MAIISKLKAILTLDNSEFKKGLKDSEKQTSNFNSAITKVGGAIAAAFTVKEIVQFGSELGALYPKVRNVTSAFEALSGTDLLQDLRDATAGMVSDMELMQRTTQARNFGIPVEQLATYFEFASIRAAETGESVDYLVNSLIIGLGRKSTMVLDNLGISLIEIQKEVEKVGDFNVAVGNIIERESKKSTLDIDEITSGTVKLEKSWENYKNFLSQSAIGQWFDDLKKSAAEALDVMTMMPKDIKLQGKEMEDLIKMQAIWFKNSQADMQAYGEVSAFTARQIERIQKAMANIATPELAQTTTTRVPNINTLTGKTPGIFGGSIVDDYPKLKTAIDAVSSSFAEATIITREYGGALEYNKVESQETIDGFLKLNEVMQETIDISGAVVGGIVSISQAVGQLIAGDNTVNVLENFMRSIGGLLQQFGAALIAFGIAKISVKLPGPIAIAAGAALVAAGAAMSYAQKGATSVASGSYGGYGSYGGSYSGGGGYYTDQREIVLVARGNDLVSVLNRQTYQNYNNG